MGLFGRDENDNKIDNRIDKRIDYQIETSIGPKEETNGRSKIDRCNLFGDKRLIKQTSFAQNDENDLDAPTDRISNCSNDKLDIRTDRTDRSIRETADKSDYSLSGVNVNKKYSTVTAELKVATLEEDLSSINSPNSLIELDGKKAKNRGRLDLRLYQRIRGRLFDRAGARRNCTNRARLITMKDKSNREIAKESITDELCTGERSRESNV